jgi:hypothetical protein
MDGEEGLVDLLSDYLRTFVAGVQLVAKVLVPQPGADVGQGNLLAVAELLQPCIVDDFPGPSLCKADLPAILLNQNGLLLRRVDLLEATWNATTKTLSGRSAVVQDDPYVITFYVPEGCKLRHAGVAGKDAATKQEGRWLTICFTPQATRPISWNLDFE